jgi:hypothetical protein
VYPEFGKCAKSVTMNAVIAINSSMVGKPELSRKVPVWIRKPSFLKACVRSRYSSPALVTTPQTIADGSRSSEISTVGKVVYA